MYSLGKTEMVTELVYNDERGSVGTINLLALSEACRPGAQLVAQVSPAPRATIVKAVCALKKEALHADHMAFSTFAAVDKLAMLLKHL